MTEEERWPSHSPTNNRSSSASHSTPHSAHSHAVSYAVSRCAAEAGETFRRTEGKEETREATPSSIRTPNSDLHGGHFVPRPSSFAFFNIKVLIFLTYLQNKLSFTQKICHFQLKSFPRPPNKIRVKLIYKLSFKESIYSWTPQFSFDRYKPYRFWDEFILSETRCEGGKKQGKGPIPHSENWKHVLALASATICQPYRWEPNVSISWWILRTQMSRTAHKCRGREKKSGRVWKMVNLWNKQCLETLQSGWWGQIFILPHLKHTYIQSSYFPLTWW